MSKFGHRDSRTVTTAAAVGRERHIRYEEVIVPIYDEPALGWWTLVLRRQPVRLVAGRPEGGCTDAYELICCECGDNPALDYRDVSPYLQHIRGPYPLSAGIEAFGQHDMLVHELQLMDNSGAIVDLHR